MSIERGQCSFGRRAAVAGVGPAAEITAVWFLLCLVHSQAERAVIGRVVCEDDAVLWTKTHGALPSHVYGQ